MRGGSTYLVLLLGQWRGVSQPLTIRQWGCESPGHSLGRAFPRAQGKHSQVTLIYPGLDLWVQTVEQFWYNPNELWERRAPAPVVPASSKASSGLPFWKKLTTGLYPGCSSCAQSIWRPECSCFCPLFSGTLSYPSMSLGLVPSFDQLCWRWPRWSLRVFSTLAHALWCDSDTHRYTQTYTNTHKHTERHTETDTHPHTQKYTQGYTQT